MAPASYSLQGKTVLISGAARGIGAESARRVAARGARVALVGLEPGELERVASECGPDALWFEADVTESSALERAVEATVAQTGGIDVVVANAGIGAGGLMRHVGTDVFARVIEVNLIGSYRTIKACLPHVIERRGYILQNASVAALMPQFPGFSAYAASKAGAEALAGALRVEVAHLGVDVGVAYFGWIDTDLVRGGDEHPAFAELRSRIPGPLGRTAPVSVAGAAVVRAIEHRAAAVTEPKVVRAMLLLRGVLPYITAARIKRDVPALTSLFEEDLEKMAQSGPVGAGGQADARVSGGSR